jgi:putative oxidoreductase
MTLHDTQAKNFTSSPVHWFNAITQKLTAIPDGVISLFARIGVAGVFWRSGQTKVDGWEIREFTFDLFRDEYALPIIPPEFAAYMATIAEHVFPIFLILGLASRLSAAALLSMTAVIQVFVYPTSWPDHAMWAAALLFILARGPGFLSVDSLVRSQFYDEKR